MGNIYCIIKVGYYFKMHAKSFNINKKEGFLQTFFSKDWVHSIFVNQYAERMSQKIALYLIGAQIFMSIATTLYFQGIQNYTLTIAALYSLLYSVMSLSNATKNQ